MSGLRCSLPCWSICTAVVHRSPDGAHTAQRAGGAYGLELVAARHPAPTPVGRSPELGLTEFVLRDLVAEVALHADDPGLTAPCRSVPSPRGRPAASGGEKRRPTLVLPYRHRQRQRSDDAPSRCPKGSDSATGRAPDHDQSVANGSSLAPENSPRHWPPRKRWSVSLRPLPLVSTLAIQVYPIPSAPPLAALVPLGAEASTLGGDPQSPDRNIGRGQRG